eukprot:949276-Rhodomonas_salina.1
MVACARLGAGPPWLSFLGEEVDGNSDECGNRMKLSRLWCAGGDWSLVYTCRLKVRWQDDPPGHTRTGQRSPAE